MKHLLALTLILSSSLALASGDHGEAEGADVSNRVGQGKAVEAFDKEEGFKLSEKAMKSLGITFSKLSGSGTWQVPRSALVKFKQSDAVYRRYDGWISMVLVKVVSKDKSTAAISSSDLEPGDEVAMTGIPFLRMTDADLNAGTVDSCAH